MLIRVEMPYHLKKPDVPSNDFLDYHLKNSCLGNNTSQTLGSKKVVFIECEVGRGQAWILSVSRAFGRENSKTRTLRLYF